MPDITSRAFINAYRDADTIAEKKMPDDAHFDVFARFRLRLLSLSRHD